MEDPRKLRVAVLLGGQSPEHDVSIASGLNVLEALDPDRHVGTPVYITRDGHWRFGHLPDRPSLEVPEGERTAPTSPASRPEPAVGASASGPAAESAGGALERMRRGAEFDVVFIALHGPGGEDGSVQGLLTLAGIPFTGSGVLASALAMDKVMTKRIYEAAGIPTPRHHLVAREAFAAEDSATPRALTGASSGEERDAAADSLARSDSHTRSIVDTALQAVGLPCVVKPAASGSSVAIRIAGTREAVIDALDDALQEDERALVERHVAGTEVTCGVLGGGPHEATEPLPLTEIVPRDGEFFDYRAKYTVGACDEITPARVDDATTQRVQELAARAHDALGCEGMSRTDFILQEGEPFALETNTIPGMTETSLLPQGAAALGISFAELVHRLIRSATARPD